MRLLIVFFLFLAGCAEYRVNDGASRAGPNLERT